MFLVVGKGSYFKDALMKLLADWGFSNVDEIVKEAETKGKYCKGIRILHVKC